MSYNFLFLITARGGSKGIPGKNIKPLAGKPLIHYSIDTARMLADDKDICVSTDDAMIKRVAEDHGLHVPFTRPAELATDTAGSYEVLLHALNYYESIGRSYNAIVLLQPTSPFRKASQVKEAMEQYDNSLDMVVSVKASKVSPFSFYTENEEGYLQPMMPNNYTRRQDMPVAYEYNGAIYVINTASLRAMPLSSFKKVKKYVMGEPESLDIDTNMDWYFAEFLVGSGIVANK